MSRKRNKLNQTRWIFAVALTLLTSGCLGRSPDSRLFTLGSEARSVETESGSEIAILVGPARFPRYLETPQMTRRLAGGELEVDEFNRWAGGFEGNVLSALALDLSNRLGSDRIVSHPSTPPFATDYRVRIHFDEFVVGPDDLLRLRVRWAIVAGDGSGTPAIGRTDLDIPLRSSLAGDSKVAVVSVHDEAIRALGRAIAERVESLEAAAP